MKSSSYLMISYRFAQKAAAVILFTTFIVSCKKDDVPPKNEAGQYSSEVIDKWINLQLRLMRNTTGVANQAFSRPYAYTGIAAYEAIAPAFKNSQRWTSRWNGLTGLPVANPATKYYLPANVNAALAAMNRALFATAPAVDKAAIDSLETALLNSFGATQNPQVLEASEIFGKHVASAVIAWAQTDGASNANAPYTAPVGPGLWKPTAPAFAAPATPYWGAVRPVIKGSTTGAQAPAPVAYSTATNSPFHNMVKAVFDASQNLTEDQKHMANFWRDVPGQTSPGHWLSILKYTLQKDGSKLDKACVAYALTGAAINDALIICFANKYQYNVVRPITYIREVMGHTTWNAHLGTPAHPEYPSAHSSLSAAAGDVMTRLFGNIGTIPDHTHDYLGFPTRSFSSFNAIAEDAGLSRFYAGIHYKPSINAGLTQGHKVANNIFSIK